MQRTSRYPSAAGYLSMGMGLANGGRPGAPPSLDDGLLAFDSFDDFDTAAANKKRNIERACDFCRKRKTKCDGPSTQNHVCTNCTQNGHVCTYMEASKPRGPPKAYVTALEDRMEKMEALLTRLRPETDLATELGPTILRDSWKDPSPPSSEVKRKSSKAGPLPAKAALALSPPPPQLARPAKGAALTARSRSHSVTESSDNESGRSSDGSSDTEDVGELSLIPGLKRLTMNGLQPPQADVSATSPVSPGDSQLRYHGKSSALKLLSATRKLKEEYADQVSAARSPTMSQDETMSTFSHTSSAVSCAREEYWATPAWELAWEGANITSPDMLPAIAQSFPPADLADALINLFFEHVNIQWPLLHRATFERQWKQELHKRDVWFACLCLTMFAVASRWSEDERVLPEGQAPETPSSEPSENAAGSKWHKAGWNYFEVAVEIHQARRSIVHPAGLFEVQTHCLLAMYLRGTEFDAAAWLYISVGLRKSQDIGAHRRKMYGRIPTAETELWKRAFWTLVVLDRHTSAHLGRDCCSREEEFDIDLPIEVDDEFWEVNKGAGNFVQPEGKPSTVAAFNSRIKLSQVMAFAMRTVCATEKSKNLLGLTGRRWKEKVVGELNSALTEWAKSVPEHLRWNAEMPNRTFYHQSATLYANYYLLQVMIYRPFIPPPCSWTAQPCVAPHPHPHIDFPFAAAALCLNAAKSIARIVNTVSPKGASDAPMIIGAAHTAAAIMVMHVWELKVRDHSMRDVDVKPPPPSVQPQVDALTAESEKMFTALEKLQDKWANAGVMLGPLKSSLPGRDDELNVPLATSTPSQMTVPGVPSLPVLNTPSNDQWDMAMDPSPSPNGQDWYTPEMNDYNTFDLPDYSGATGHPAYNAPVPAPVVRGQNGRSVRRRTDAPTGLAHPSASQQPQFLQVSQGHSQMGKVPAARRGQDMHPNMFHQPQANMASQMPKIARYAASQQRMRPSMPSVGYQQASAYGYNGDMHRNPSSSISPYSSAGSRRYDQVPSLAGIDNAMFGQSMHQPALSGHRRQGHGLPYGMNTGMQPSHMNMGDLLAMDDMDDWSQYPAGGNAGRQQWGNTGAGAMSPYRAFGANSSFAGSNQPMGGDAAGYGFDIQGASPELNFGF